ncbi:gluconokinase [Phenylobacterium sp.]|jgi:gluconokinase|uniref:gluconokinase n=1 Tax=Phenylobacterium sp. TaxID=1871053 RepID=UPI002F42C764
MAATVLLVMGVAGAGKSTLGAALAERLGWAFLEADDLHPPANVEKMRAGVPLDDADRAPWLAAVGRFIDGWAVEGRPGVVACSALKRAYRDTLRAAHPHLRLVYVATDETLAHIRVGRRADHYYPASLVPSQFAALEPPAADEDAITVDAAQPTEAQVVATLAAL